MRYIFVEVMMWTAKKIPHEYIHGLAGESWAATTCTLGPGDFFWPLGLEMPSGANSNAPQQNRANKICTDCTSYIQVVAGKKRLVAE